MKTTLVSRYHPLPVVLHWLLAALYRQLQNNSADFSQ